MDRAAPYGAASRIVPAAARPHPRIRFSGIELLHLTGAVAALTYAFAVINNRPPAHLEGSDAVLALLAPDLWTVLASLAAVATGFVLHELAHKVAAQRFGHWAEFRAAVVGLLLALAMSPLGILVALPGATWIQGSVTRRESGIISLVGPAFNFIVAWLAFPLSIAVNREDPVPKVFGLVASVNSFLAVFNLLPVVFFRAALDGLKVWRWSKPIWVASFVAALASAVFIFLVDQGLVAFA